MCQDAPSLVETVHQDVSKWLPALLRHSIKELCAKMPPSSPYNTFISSFLKLGTVRDENAPELLAAVEAIAGDLDKAKASLTPSEPDIH